MPASKRRRRAPPLAAPPSPSKPPTPTPSRDQATDTHAPLVPIKPVPEKIGEGRDNLKARERAFQKRRQRSGS